MSVRSSAEILGLPTRLPDRERQYEWNPARCQRMIVSGRRIAMAPRMEGNQQQSQTNRKRSILLSCGRFDTCRRSTLSCWRRTRISASSFALDLKSEATMWRISWSNSIIRWQDYRVAALRLAESNFRHTHAAGASMARGEMVGFDGRRCGVTNSAALIGGSKKSPAQRGLRLSE